MIFTFVTSKEIYNQYSEKFGFRLEDLINNNSYAYSSLLHAITNIDVDHNALKIIKIYEGYEKYVNSLQTLCGNVENKYKNINQSIIKSIANIYEILSQEGNSSKSMTKAYDEALKAYNNYKSNSKELLGEVADTINLFSAYDYYKTESSFKKLSDMTFDVLIPVIGDKNCINYFSSLVDICKEIIKICVFRWNEEAGEYIQTLEKTVNNKSKSSYKELKGLIDASNICNESIDEVMTRLNEVRHKVK